MGLDAFVFCDCYEKGRLLEPPPSNGSLRVGPDGSLGREQDEGTIESDLAWDNWREHRACKHKGGILLHHRLGNIALIGLLRSELQREPSRFPILFNQVVYSGSHAGDFIALETLPKLKQELDRLSEFRCGQEAGPFISEFQKQMLELTDRALSIGKAIVF